MKRGPQKEPSVYISSEFCCEASSFIFLEGGPPSKSLGGQGEKGQSTCHEVKGQPRMELRGQDPGASRPGTVGASLTCREPQTQTLAVCPMPRVTWAPPVPVTLASLWVFPGATKYCLPFTPPSLEGLSHDLSVIKCQGNYLCISFKFTLQVQRSRPTLPH